MLTGMAKRYNFDLSTDIKILGPQVSRVLKGV
jgi:hypothetical protein